MAEFRSGTTAPGAIARFLFRLVLATIVLAITAFLTPGFAISGLVPLLISALVISVLDFALEKTGLHASPFGRGITGFVLAAAIIYFTQFVVVGYSVTLLSAFIGALIYGIVDALIPGKAM